MTDKALDLSEFSEDEQLRILNGLEKLKAEVLDEREQSRIQMIQNCNRIATLRIAADFLEWLYTHRRGATFSAFVCEFGYDSSHASDVYKYVMAFLGLDSKFEYPSSASFSDVDYPKPPYVVDAEDE